MRKPSEIYQTGLNCGESVISAYNEEKGAEKLPICIGSGMGSGLGSFSACGAVLGAGVLIGLEAGRSAPGQENRAKPCTKELVETVREAFGSEICGELKAKQVNCAQIMDFTYEKMKEILAREEIEGCC